MRPRRLRYYCETHDAWLVTSDHALHNALTGCVLTVWESVPQASPARPNVGGNLAPEGGHMRHPVLISATASEESYQIRTVRGAHPGDSELYVSLSDIINWLSLHPGAPVGDLIQASQGFPE